MRFLFALVVALSAVGPLHATDYTDERPDHIGKIIYDTSDPTDYGSFGGGAPSGGSYNIVCYNDTTGGYKYYGWVAYKLDIEPDEEVKTATCKIQENLLVGTSVGITAKFMKPLWSSAPDGDDVHDAYQDGDWVDTTSQPGFVFDGNNEVTLGCKDGFNEIIADSNYLTNHSSGGGWFVIILEAGGNGSTHRFDGFEYDGSGGPKLSVELEAGPTGGPTDWEYRWRFETEGSGGRFFDDRTPNNEDIDLVESGTVTLSSPIFRLDKGATLSTTGYLEGDVVKDVGGPGTNWTLILWADSSTSETGYVAAQGFAAEPDRGWNIEQVGTTIRCRLYTVVSPGQQSGQLIQITGVDTSLKYYVLQYNKTSDEFRLRVNDSVTEWRSLGGDLHLDDSAAFTIGELSGGTGTLNWGGTVYYAGFWDRILSTTELDYFYNNGFGRQE